MSDSLNRAKEFKDQGNKEFSKKDYNKAVDCYSQAIDELIKDRKEQQSEESILLSVLYCNRAACYISLSEFYKAHYDAIKCLENDPTNYKAKFRKAISLIGLDADHKQAYDLFTELNNYDKVSQLLGKPLKDEIVNTRSILSQQEGKYDLMTLPFDPKLQESLHVQNFVGPLTIKTCLDNTKKGRGMFLTRNVEAGELLLVEKAFAYALDDTQIKTLRAEDSHANANTILKQKLKTEIEKKLSYDTSTDNNKRQKLSYIYQPSASQSSISPSIELYQPKYKRNLSTESSVENQVAHINLNSIGNASNGTMYSTDGSSTLANISIDDIITYNSFDLEIVSTPPDDATREAIIKTIDFLCSEKGASRRDVQIPTLTTKLQEFVLSYDSIAMHYQKLSDDNSIENKEKIRATIVEAENGPVKYYFHAKSKDTDYNCSRDRSQQQQPQIAFRVDDNSTTQFQPPLSCVCDDNENNTTADSIADLTEKVIKDAVANNQLNAIDNLGCSALHYAVITSNLKLVQLLLATEGIDVNIHDKIGYTALHYASGQYYSKDVLTALCSSYFKDSKSSSKDANTTTTNLSRSVLNINVFNNQYLTPLYFAATSYNIKAMFILLKAGANPLLGHPYPLFSPSPIQYAVDNGYKQHLQMYEAAGYTYHNSSCSSSKTSANSNKSVQQLQQKSQRGIGLWLLTSFFNHADNKNSNSNNSSTPATPIVDTATDNTITDTNIISSTTISDNNDTINPNTANTVRVFIGQFIFIFADRNMKADTELLITYSQNKDTLNDNWGINE